MRQYTQTGRIQYAPTFKHSRTACGGIPRLPSAATPLEKGNFYPIPNTPNPIPLYLHQNAISSELTRNALPSPGMNVPNAGQNLPNGRQNVPNGGQNLPNAGSKMAKISHHAHNGGNL
jgi:hypothetical protein